jgi:hypothetical protein
MFNVVYQLHGAADVCTKFFSNRVLANIWVEENAENFSLCYITEVFH